MADEPFLPSTSTPTWLYPWVRLFRCVGLATDPKKLMLAALGLLVLNLGWRGLDQTFPGPPDTMNGPLWEWPRIGLESDPGPVLTRVMAAPLWLAAPPWRLVGPFTRVFSARSEGWQFVHALLSGLWAVAVWGIVGGAIARMALVQGIDGERLGMKRAVRFALRHAMPLIGGPLCPLLGVVIFGAVCAGFGLLFRLTASVPAVAAVLLVFPLLAGLVMALIVVGLAVGWPLMHASVAAEAEDGFDAVSRSYAYVHQRPGRYAGYVVVAALVGSAGAAFVVLFAQLVVQLTAWGLSFTMPPALRTEILSVNRGPGAYWLFLVSLLVQAWTFSYFWTAMTYVYLLLRRDVDRTDWYQIAREGPAAGSFTPPPKGATVASDDAVGTTTQAPAGM